MTYFLIYYQISIYITKYANRQWNIQIYKYTMKYSNIQIYNEIFKHAMKYLNIQSRIPIYHAIFRYIFIRSRYIISYSDVFSNIQICYWIPGYSTKWSYYLWPHYIELPSALAHLSAKCYDLYCLYLDVIQYCKQHPIKTFSIRAQKAYDELPEAIYSQRCCTTRILLEYHEYRLNGVPHLLAWISQYVTQMADYSCAL